MNTLTLSPEQNKELQARNAQVREAWGRDVTTLAQQIATWSEKRGWSVQWSDEEIREDATIGTYRVPKLEIATPEGSAVLAPVARGVIGADGRVDLYAWPSHFRVMLLRKTHRQVPTEWIIRTESGLDWPQPWNEQTFATILTGLINAS